MFWKFIRIVLVLVKYDVGLTFKAIFFCFFFCFLAKTLGEPGHCKDNTFLELFPVVIAVEVCDIC